MTNSKFQNLNYDQQSTIDTVSSEICYGTRINCTSLCLAMINIVAVMNIKYII